MHDKSVADLQRLLNDALRLKAPLPITGVFGPRTYSAVLRFQRLHGLRVDGVVGPLTWARIEPWRRRPLVRVTAAAAGAAAAAAAAAPAKAAQPKIRDPAQDKVTHTWVWDAPHDADARQYINLPADWDPPRNGRAIELVGHVEPRDPGVSVTLRLVANPKNDELADAASLGATSLTTGSQGVGRVKLSLPVYAGTRFKVAGKTADMDSPVNSGEIEVWRKVFYQVTEMANSPAPDNVSFAAPGDMISALTAAFTPVFFEVAPGVKSKASTPYQAHLTAAQRGTLENSLRSSAVDARSPFKLNIVIIDRADIVAEQEWTSSATTASVVTPWFLTWTYESTLIYAQQQKPDGTWQDLANAQVITHPTDARFSAVSADVAQGTPPAPVNVRIKYRYQRGNAGGWGGTTGTLFMCIGRQRRANAASPTGAELQQALTHEMGHALGLVAPGAAWHDPDPRDAGYSLRHCKYQDTATPPEPRCVMWYMLGGSGPRLRFCKDDKPNDCAHFLIRTDYASLHWI